MEYLAYSWHDRSFTTIFQPKTNLIFRDTTHTQIYIQLEYLMPTEASETCTHLYTHAHTHTHTHTH